MLVHGESHRQDPCNVSSEPCRKQARLGCVEGRDHVHAPGLLAQSVTKHTNHLCVCVNGSAIGRHEGVAKIWLIEDSCDTMTCTPESDISVVSFYASHVITAGGCGGMVMFNE